MHSLHKEQYFLKYNKANIATDLIQSEKHLQSLKEGKIEGGHANCVVKHTLDAAGESREATSHALIVESEERSQKFKFLGDSIRAFREKLMEKNLTRSEAIRGIRKLKRQFESFNPEFDVSQCESCGSIEDVLRQTNSVGNPAEEKKEKVLNTQPSNRNHSESIMNKNIAIVYGANFGGKLIDEVLRPRITEDVGLAVTLGLAVGLPVIAKFAKLKNGPATGLLTLGAYESTNLYEVIAKALAPSLRVAVVRTPMAYPGYPMGYKAAAVKTPTGATAVVTGPTAKTKYVVTA